jgi:hypothetical protein
MNPWRAAGLVGLTAFLLLLATLPNVLSRLDPLTGDEPFYVMTAISIVRDGDLDESNNYANEDFNEFYPGEPLPANWRGWPSFPRPLPPHPATSEREGLHTKHGLGLSLLIAGPYEAFGRVGAVLLIMTLAGLLASQMFLLAREAGASATISAAIAVGLTIAMPVGPYATLLFPAIPEALLLIYAVRRVGNLDNTLGQWALAGAAIGFLPWLHQRYAPTAVVLALILLIRLVGTRDLRGGVASMIPVAVGGFSLLAYNQWLYGVPLQRVEDHAGFHGPSGTLNGAMGLVLDAQWGLWVVAPVMLLALAAYPRWLATNRSTALVALATLLPYLLVLATYRVWWGEWGPAARYLVSVAPFAAGPLGAWLGRAGWRGKAAAISAWFFGMVLTLIGYQDPQRFYHHPDGVNNLYQRLGELLHLPIQRVLVPFQPYGLAPLNGRFWLSVAALLLLSVATWAISRPEISAEIASIRRRTGRARS